MAELNLGGIIPESVVDGPGIRFVVFAQGCLHNCPGCFNRELQAFTENRIMSVNQVIALIDQYQSRGITFSGGDPFEQVPAFTKLAVQCRKRGLSIWCYTGYTFEQLLKLPEKFPLLEQLDVLVDGPFVQKYKDISLKFRGSSNQRLIDVQASLRQKQVVLLAETA